MKTCPKYGNVIHNDNAWFCKECGTDLYGKNNGGKTDLFWDDEETHFILVNQTDKIIDFMSKNLK